VSRRSARNRRRAAFQVNQQAVKQGRPPPGGVTFTADQMSALLQLQQGNTRAKPMPRPDQWAEAPFGPSRPLVPAPINIPRPDTQRAEPRLFEYPVAWNIQIDNTRRHVPWRTLQEAADMPLFRKCIKRRKGICQLGYTVTVDPKAVAREAALTDQPEKDVESAIRKKYTAEIARVSDWLSVPDRKNGYDWPAWTSLIMENYLKYDAVAVYPRQTFGGDLFALEVIDGKTIKPLLDEYGGRPLPPFPAYQQILYGFPRGEFTATMADPDQPGSVPGGLAADQLLYKRREIRSETPYGFSDTELALVDGLLWTRRLGWITAEYTEGVQPESFLKNNGEVDWTPQQVEDYARWLNDRLSGNTAERMRWQMLPPGVEPVQSATDAERYKPDYDMFIIKLVAGDFGLTATELGFPEVGSLGASFHEGEEDVLQRVTRRPDAQWLASIATELAVSQLGMPDELQVTILGLESEDEAAADAVADAQVRGGRATLNEDRARRGEPPYQFAEADMPMLELSRGVVFLEGASQTAPPGMLIEPPQAPPAGAQLPAGNQDEEDGEEPPARKPPQQQPPTVKAELGALRSYLRKGTRRPFECQALTPAILKVVAPDLAGHPRVTFKAGDAPKARAPGARGLAGTGTRT
jgi:hypothetical protein